ncbi:YhfG family protein [Pseudomonas sp. PB105]|uniref:YhfG family protein n=1 Tax=unclassified Pseudomonas TaxID=196821 RepID=UPI0035326A4A
MSEPTFEQKQDHYHKIRRSNYLASLRLATRCSALRNASRLKPRRSSGRWQRQTGLSAQARPNW